MKLKMPVDRKVITSVGHTIDFKKDKAVTVPAAAVKDCLAQGACVVEGVVEVEESKKEELQIFGPQRDAAIKKQMEKMVARNNREDFTGAGKPDVFTINKELGFTISAQERDAMWDEVRQDLSADNDPADEQEDSKSEDE